MISGLKMNYACYRIPTEMQDTNGGTVPVFSLCAVMNMHVLRKTSWICSENSLSYALYMIGEGSYTFSLSFFFSLAH